ncbi:uncharacterized protein LOC143022292 [Oratosquilla oratoria]|uniref:uncharacterized protein LOC143022292 n=1 Tax=Oratosquilla oratoria TaxID=337810 RepID=UPI003F773C04
METYVDLSPPKGEHTDLSLFELKWALRAIKATKKSPGADKIVYPLLRHLPPALQQSLLAIYNKCWREGLVPLAWKHAIVVPIPKAGKQRNLVENHRPVALTSHVGKVYERIILNRLSHHVDSNKCLPKLQAGFRRGRSVTDHVVKLAEHIRRARRQRRILHTCFLDISKAFDTVWHTKLLLKLKSIGVSPAIFNFVKSFLAGRTIAVRWKGIISSQAKIDMGVPTLHPATSGGGRGALWRKSRYRRPKKNSANHRAEVRVFQEQVDVVVNHLMDLGFTLSGTKTVYMPVHSKGYNAGQYPDWNQITVCGTAVKPAASVRYLGVTFQRDGLWNEHLRLACLSARRALNLVRVIRREKWGQRRETLIPIIQSLVRSRLLFGAPALHDLPPTAVQRIARVECQALRLGLGLAKSVPQAQIYNEAGLLPLRHCLKKGALRDICKKAKIQPGQRRRIAQCQVDPFPPWALTPPEVELNLPGLSRRDDPHTLAARAREQIALKYRDDLLIYTDGSVFEDGRSGAGIYLYNTKEAHPCRCNKGLVFSYSLDRDPHGRMVVADHLCEGLIPRLTMVVRRMPARQGYFVYVPKFGWKKGWRSANTKRR